MNIIVCVKQVPDTNDVKMDKQTNTLIREGVQSILNPFDMYAVEEGILLKEQYGGKVTTLSMGIPAVCDMLKETIALGVDEGVLLTDRVFAGADTLATSYALYTGIKELGDFDLIICGKQATDGDTAQVGPSLAERLGIPHTTYVRKIEEIGDGKIRCQRMTEDGYEVIEMPLPALITVVKEINEPRLPTIKGKMNARKAEIKQLTAADVGADAEKCGLKGSATQVIKTFVPEHNIVSEMIEGTPEEQAAAFVDKLLSMKTVKIGG